MVSGVAGVEPLNSLSQAAAFPFPDNHRLWESPSDGFRVQSASITGSTFRKVLLRYSDIERLLIAEKVLSIHMGNMNAGR